MQRMLRAKHFISSKSDYGINADAEKQNEKIRELMVADLELERTESLERTSLPLAGNRP